MGVIGGSGLLTQPVTLDPEFSHYDFSGDTLKGVKYFKIKDFLTNDSLIIRNDPPTTLSSPEYLSFPTRTLFMIRGDGKIIKRPR